MTVKKLDWSNSDTPEAESDGYQLSITEGTITFDLTVTNESIGHSSNHTLNARTVDDAVLEAEDIFDTILNDD